MVPNTKYIKCFHLELFDCGFILRLPDSDHPEQLAPFHPSIKVFQTLYDDTKKSEALKIPMWRHLNEAICRGEATQIILAHEA